jgi:hypothetical protein
MDINGSLESNDMILGDNFSRSISVHNSSLRSLGLSTAITLFAIFGKHFSTLVKEYNLPYYQVKQYGRENGIGHTNPVTHEAIGWNLFIHTTGLLYSFRASNRRGIAGTELVLTVVTAVAQ